ncbi:MAG TPA: hypothetical protein VGM67_19500 [Gemmatimonadaceae bacterium]
MSEVQTAPNLGVLQDDYEIHGELRSGERVGTYLGQRRADGTDVVITVVQEPKGGENNALNHFAADTQLLSQLSNPHVPQVIEGRWVGKNQFAVVSKRYQTESLDERLARGEKYTPPQIAAILREVDSVLEWARQNGIVHRGVTPDSLTFEAGSNRVLIVLEPTPIPMEGVPDAGADAHTIGALAWAMFTGERYVDGQSLAEMRPDLAKRVTDDTEAMVRSTSGDTRDVSTFVGVVAAADALRAGEMEIAEMQADILEARRNELATFEAEQRSCAAKNAELQEQLADERKEFERKMADEETELASVKAAFADLKANEEAQLAAERSQFEHEMQELARERAEFEHYMTERNAEIAAKHADVDRIRAEEGKRIDAAIAAAVQTVADTAVVPPPVEDSTPATPPRPAPWIEETVRKHAVGTGEPAVAKARRGARVDDDADTNGDTDTGAFTPAGRPRWVIPISIAALIIVLVGIFAATHHSAAAPGSDVRLGRSTIIPTAPTTDVRGTPRGGFLTQSAGGTVAAPVGPPVSPNATPAAAAPNGVARAADSTAAKNAAVAAAASQKRREAEASATKPKPTPKRAAEAPQSENAFSAEADAIRRAEAARDSAARRDSVTVPPPDTLRRSRT